MQKEKERYVKILDLQLHSMPQEGPLFDIRDIAEKIQDQFILENAVNLINYKTKAIRILDLEIDDNEEHLTLLINSSDKRISDPALSSHVTGEVRNIPKKKHEGVAVSAHMVISFKKRLDGRPPVFLCVLEEANGINRGVIDAFLTNVLKNAYKGKTYICPATTKPKMIRPRIELDEFASKSFVDSLKNKQVSFIEFYETSQVTGIDNDTLLKPIHRKVKFVLTAPENESTPELLYRNIKERFTKDSFDGAKVTFRMPDSKTRSESVSLDRESEATSVLFGRQERIPLNNKLLQCEEKISNELSAKMQGILKREVAKFDA